MMARPGRPSAKRAARLPAGAGHERSAVAGGASAAGAGLRIADAARWLSVASLAALIVVVTLVPSDSIAVEQGGALPLLPIAVLAWAGSLVAAPQRSSRLDRLFDAVVWSIALWMFIAAAAVAGVGNLRAAVSEAWWWATAAATITAARRSLTADQSRATVLVLLIALSSGLAVQATHQQWIILPAERARYEADPEEVMQRFERESGISAPPGSPQRALFEGRLYGGGPTATFALENSLAAYLMIGVILAGGVLVRLRRSRPPAARLAVATGVSVVLCATALVWTASRSALLAVAAVGAPSLAWPIVARAQTNADPSAPPATGRFRVAWAAGMLAAVVAMVAAIVAASYRTEWLSGARRSLRYRLEYWRATVDMLADSPWFGAGPGNFQDRYVTYRLDQASEGIADPHNWVMETWAAGGTPAVLLLSGAIAMGCAIVARRPELPITARRQRWAIACGTAVGLVGVLVTWISQLYLPDFDALVLSVLAAVAIGLALGPLAKTPLAQSPLANVESGVGGTGGQIAVRSIAGPAVIAVAVHLLVAGGWTVPGVAVPLLVLIGITVGAPRWAGTRLDAPAAAQGERPVEPRHRGVIAAIGVALAIAWWSTAWLPHTRAAQGIARGDAAFNAGRIDVAAEAYRAAEQADPWDPRAAVRRADAWRWVIVHHQDPAAARGRWQQAWESAIGRNPRSANAWTGRAEQRLHFFQRFGEREDLEFAREDLLRAIALSRSEVGLAAQLAVVEAALGRREAAEQWRARAEQLAAAGGHEDRQLSVVQVLPAEPIGPRAEAGPLRVPAITRLPFHEPE